jgi:bacterioferritin
MKHEFILDIDKIQRLARAHLTDGAITENYSLDTKKVIEILNHNLAVELLCVARYKNHHYKALSLGEHLLADEFLEHAKQEQDHVDKLAVRITQLGGKPEFNPSKITEKSHMEYTECDNPISMIIENLIAERIAISTYREVINYLGSHDSTTRRLIELILAVEEEHADDLLDFFNKHKNTENSKKIINQLKEEAIDLGLKMKASDESMVCYDENESSKITNVINLINDLDDKKEYTCSDFVTNA